MSGSRQTKQFSTFQGGGGHQVSVPSVIRPMYTPNTWRMCLVPDILLKFRDSDLHLSEQCLVSGFRHSPPIVWSLSRSVSLLFTVSFSLVLFHC